MLRTYWHADNTPIATTIDQLLYDLRKDDGADGLIFDAVSFADIIEDADGRIALDAMLSPYNKLETKMGILQKVMERAGTEIKPVSQQLSEPFTQNGTANVACIFELSDGQTISVFFHNPDTTPKKIMPTDEMVSWKWLLNKKDITIVVAPEKGKDLNVRQVATRLMKLAEKNSPAFQRTNAKRAEKMQALEGLKTEVAGLEKTLKDKQHELEVAKIEAEDRGNQATPEVITTTINTNNAPESLKPLIDKINTLFSQAAEKGLNPISKEQFMTDIANGNRLGVSLETLKNNKAENLKLIADLASGKTTPRKIVGVGGTKAAANKWLNGQLNEDSIAIESGGFLKLNNLYNYQSYLNDLIKNGQDTSFESDDERAKKESERLEKRAIYDEKILQEDAPVIEPQAVEQTPAPTSIDPIAKSNIEAANISAAIKKKAIAYLNANPASHEIKGLSTKSLDAIMENIKTALFAEVKSLSPLIKQSKLMGGDSLILNIGDDGKDSIKILFSDGSYRLSFMVVKDFEGKEIFDSTSTLEGLREWGFYLPFDLDVKAFVANVIKPVVDEFLSKHEGVKNAVISMWDKVLGMTKEEFSEKVFSGNIVINDFNPNFKNQKTISQMVDFLNMIADAHPNDRDDHGFTDYKETIERKISDLYDDAEVSKKMAEAGIVNHNEYITFLDEQAGSEAEQPSNNQTKEYRYAMVNRPAGLSTVPKGFIRLEERPSAGSPHYAAARNGVVVYDRKLTDDETKKYEMSPMVDGDDLHEYADNIANEMKEYASQYVKLANNDIADFIDEVKNRLSESSAGFRPSIGDINHLAELVKNKLSDAITGKPEVIEPQAVEPETINPQPDATVDLPEPEHEVVEPEPPKQIENKNLKTLEIDVIKKNQKFFKIIVGNYECKLVIDDNSKGLALGKQTLLVEDVSVRTKYGTDVIYKLAATAAESDIGNAGIITVDVPFNKVFIGKAKKLGGKWDDENKVWVFSNFVKAEAQALEDKYGSELVPVEITFKAEDYYPKDAYTLAGIVLATATGRDSGAQLGKDIAVIKGSFNSGGSAKNWATIVKEGTVIRMMMPKDLIDDAKDNDIEIKRLNATENNAYPANGMATPPAPGVKVDIDSEIESLKQLIGTPEFSDALDRLLDKLEATGLENQYESIVSDIIIQDAQAESAKVGV